MSAMRSFTLRSLAKNRVRTIVTIAGVALAAALLTAVAASVTSLNEFLLKDEKASNGAWTARTWVEDNEAIEAARNDESIDDVFVTRDVGAYVFDREARQRFGTLLSVVSLDGDVEDMTGFKTSEGRLPQNAEEIVLPKSLDGSTELDGSAIELGSTVTIALGQRVAHLAPDANPADDPYARPKQAGVPDYRVYSDGIDQKTLADGDTLNSCDAYRSADEPGAVFVEELEDVSARAYTVVGFYEDRNLLTWSPNGYLAFSGADDSAPGQARLHVSTSAFSSMSDLESHLKNTIGDTFIDYHSTLLSYAGVTDDRALWTSLYRFAAVLAAVIMVACVSLIYNAFAISVAERTRQFGLLSSIGASKRQIRRAVVFEALAIALIGAPLGILVGIGGTALVLSALAPAIEQIAGASSNVAFSLVVNPASLAVVVTLTLITVLASVWIPARRACSVSAIDAIRNANDLRETKSTRADRSAATPWKARGLGFHRLFGISGQIANANRKRGRAKGRAASVSLGLAVVLLITAGSATNYLSLGTRYLGTNDYDISTQLMSSDGLDVETCDDVYKHLTSVEGVEGLGWSIRVDMLARTPEAMAGSSFSEQDADLRGMPMSRQGDSWQSYLSLAFIDDATFSTWARDEGIDPAPYLHGDVAGIGIRSTYGNDGSAYQYDEAFVDTGTVRVLAHATSGNASYEGIIIDDAGLKAVFSNPSGETIYREIDEVSDQMTPIRIGALAEEGPVCAPSASYQPTIILPASALDKVESGEHAGGSRDCTAVFKARDHAAASAEMIEIGEDVSARLAESADSVNFDVYDVAESAESSQMLVTIIEVFSLLFTGILMLIAMANVFNTVTNSLILRKREFAVMRSVGMGERDFRKMITCECLGFGVRGLVPGIVISIGVSYLLYLSLGGSIEGLPFTLPWSHLLLAVILVLGIMTASVLYGLRRCRTDNIAEALLVDAL